MATLVIVPKDVALKGEEQINSGNIQSVKKGVELLLQNNLVIDGASNAVGHGQRDVSNLVKKGLTALTNSPHETLGIPVGARTQEIRKAYKKNALQYHPDKNPLTTPLFQVIHAANEKLSDRELRVKEERMAAAAAATKGPARQPNAGGSHSTHSSNSGGSSNQNNAYSSHSAYSSANAKPTYEQRRSSFDTKPGQQQQQSSQQQQQQSSYQYNKEPTPAPSYPQSSAYARYAEEEAIRKQRYEDFLREQQKKVESDRRAKAFAEKAREEAERAKREAEDKMKRDAEAHFNAYNNFKKEAADFKQAAHVQAEISAKREEVLRAAAAAAAAGQAYRAGEASSGKYKPGQPPQPQGGAPGAAAGGEKDSYREKPNLRTFNGAGQPQHPSTSTKATNSSSTAYSNAHDASTASYSPRYGDLPGGAPPANGAAGYGAGVGRTYKASADGRVYPADSGPARAEAASAAASGSAGGPKPAPSAAPAPSSSSTSSTSGASSKVPPINVNEVKEKSEKYKYKYVYPPGVGGSDSSRSQSQPPDSSRSAAAPDTAKGGSVPRPFGLKCTSVGTTVIELEWNTSATYRNMLSVELSWRYLGTGAKHGWESANKLISSGKCRKKNLISGGQYEFKVRAVEELVGGMLGNRSDWSDSIFITLTKEGASGSTSQKDKVPTSVNVPKQPEPIRPAPSPTPTAVPTAAAPAPAPAPAKVTPAASTTTNTATASTSSSAAPSTADKPSPGSMPASFQRFNPKSESPSPDAPAAATAAAQAPPDKPEKPRHTTNVPPPIHRFSTINETGPNPGPASHPMSRNGSAMGDSKSVLSASAREAWGKDTIKVPSTPDKPNPNNNVSGTNYSRTSQVKNNNFPTSSGGVSSTAAEVPKPVVPDTAAPPPSSRSAIYDEEFEVDEDIEYSSGGEEEDSGEEEGTEVEEEDNASAAVSPRPQAGGGGGGEDTEEPAEEVESDDDSGMSTGIAYSSHNLHSRSEDDLAPLKTHLPNAGTKKQTPQKTTPNSTSSQEYHRSRPADSDDDDDYVDSPVAKFRSVDPSLLPRQAPQSSSATATAAAAAYGKGKAAIVEEGVAEDEDEYSQDEDSFDQEEEQYFDLAAPPGHALTSTEPYKHTVRLEPFLKSRPIGHLVVGYSILTIADCGDWLKVRVHVPNNKAPRPVSASGIIWGWCLSTEKIDGKRHEYMHRIPHGAKVVEYHTVVKPAGGVVGSTSADSLPSLAHQSPAAAAHKTAVHKDEPSGGKTMNNSISAPKLSTPLPATKHTTAKASPAQSHITPLNPTSHLTTPTAASVASSITHSTSSTSIHHSGGGGGSSSRPGKVSPPTAGSTEGGASRGNQFHAHKVSKSGDKGRKAPKASPSHASTPSKASAAASASKQTPSSSTSATTTAATAAAESAPPISIEVPTSLHDDLLHEKVSAATTVESEKAPDLHMLERKLHAVNSIRLAPLTQPKVGGNSTYKIQAPSRQHSHEDMNLSADAASGASTGDSKEGGGGGSEKSVCETWLELFDASGHPYYYCEATGESTWDAPEWIEERDPASGHKYYVKLSNGSDGADVDSTWTKPKKYAKLIRKAQ